MAKLLMFMMVVAFTLTLWVKDIEIYLMDRAFRHAQYSLQHAVHDGALHIDEEALGEGKVVFIPSLAEQSIRDSLLINLGLDSQLRPTSTIFYKEQVQIDELIYFDDSYIDPNTGNGILFPYTWNYTNPLTGKSIERIIFGPSVGIVVDLKIVGVEGHTKRVAIQEYKGEFLQN